MKFMLDTNICIFIIKNKPVKVLENLRLNMDEGITISSITLGELEYGVCLSEHKEKNSDALAQFLSLITILTFDESAAAEYGEIRANLRRKGTPIGALDELIAAHAKAKDLILVTNNSREFKRVEGLKIEDWV